LQTIFPTHPTLTSVLLILHSFISFIRIVMKQALKSSPSVIALWL